MRVLAVVGSPRKRGNTDLMADAVLRGAAEAGAETSKVYLDDHRIRPIAEVGDDARSRDDPRSDDDFPALLDQFLNADVIVWSTPVYWQGPSAQMKCFLDRMSSYFRRPPYAARFDGKGHLVLCAFGRKEPEHGKWVTEPMKVAIEVLRGRYLGEVCAAATYEKGTVAGKPEILAACRALGRQTARDASA